MARQHSSKKKKRRKIHGGGTVSCSFMIQTLKEGEKKSEREEPEHEMRSSQSAESKKTNKTTIEFRLYKYKFQICREEPLIFEEGRAALEGRERKEKGRKANVVFVYSTTYPKSYGSEDKEFRKRVEV